MALGLYLDLAVGSRRGGAETWCETDTIAQGVSIGAPPDHLSPAGQKWNLAAFAPEKLFQNKYKAFRDTIAEAMRHAGVLRIDHVLGLNRSFWIPDDGSPGGYIRQPFEALLAIVAIEAERANTVVIGEDLGLVPKGFREALAARGLYSYSVLQYEKNHEGHYRDPATLREQSLACFGTHDTPTLKGFWKGRDIDWWRKLGWIDDGKSAELKAGREHEKANLLALDGLDYLDNPGFGNVSEHVHGLLAQSPAAMVAVQLDDILGQCEAQNLPGTIDEHPNWRRRCKLPLESFDGDARFSRLGRQMEQCGRGELPEHSEEEGTQ
jgi:4-alpha-glucanotransferase